MGQSDRTYKQLALKQRGGIFTHTESKINANVSVHLDTGRLGRITADSSIIGNSAEISLYFG